MKKHNILKVIIILILILIICIGLGIIIIINQKKDQNDKIHFNGKYNEELKNGEDNLKDDNQIISETEEKEPNGTAYEFEIKETSEGKKNYANNEEKLVEHITIDDFTMIVPEKLKDIGYNVEVINNNRIIEIKSKDNKYNSRIARFSNKDSELSKEQQKELEEICNEIAKETCNSKGISEDNKNYKQIYNNEYSKINASNDKILEFFNKYNINRHTSFRGFTEQELEEAWNLLGVDINNIGIGYCESYGRILKTTFEKGTTKSSKWEIGDDEYDKVLFKGLFLRTETFTGDDNELQDYAVNFLVL